MTKDSTGMIHTVFFWLKEGMSDAQRADFRRGVQSLFQIEMAERFYVGEASTTDARDVVDHSYDYALIVHFKDIAAHDAYQDHPIHHKFVADCAKYFAKVQVYDTAVE